MDALVSTIAVHTGIDVRVNQLRERRITEDAYQVIEIVAAVGGAAAAIQEAMAAFRVATDEAR
jgi:hypothetical protein